MRIIFYTQCFFIVIFAFSAWASDTKCSPIDLRTPELGKPLDQGSTFWCYAYVASDLITQVTGKRASPTDIAMNNIKENSIWERVNQYFTWGDSSKGGFVDKAIEKLNGQVCDIYDAPAELNQINAGLALIEKTNKLRAIPPAMRSSCQSDYVDNISLLFPNGNLVELISAAAELNINEAWSKLRSQGCPNGKIKFNPNKAWRISGKPETDEQPDLILALDQQLDKKRIVAVEFDPNLILKPEYRSSRPIIDFFSRKQKHVSSVVARRLIDGECRYLIRGSDGPSCKIFEIERCDKDDPGNVWVTFDELAKNSSSITYMKSEE